MKPLLALSVVAAALGLDLGTMSVAHAGACGPGMGAGQTAGTLAGAAAGGVIGNQFGKGSGKDVATVAGIIAGGLVGNQAGESIDAQNCAPPAQPVVVAPAAPPPVVYQPAPVVAYPPPPPAYPPPAAYIVESQVAWGEPVYMGPGRDCRAYSQWAVVNGTMQPVYGVACRDYYGWRYERPYEGAWRINLEFDHDHRFDHDHDRDRDHHH
jgi:surface antigen